MTPVRTAGKFCRVTPVRRVLDGSNVAPVRWVLVGSTVAPVNKDGFDVAPVKSVRESS